MADAGRPEYTDETYGTWLEELRPHLVFGSSLWRCIEKAGLETHRESIYKKYRLKDWFSEKIDKLRAMPGEKANEAMTRLVEQIQTKVIQEKPLSAEEIKILTFFSEKHRSAQPFFVNRTETATARPIEDIVADLERVDTVDDVAREAKEQVVAA